MKCARCRHTLSPAVDGWANCPKCGLGKFVGTAKPAKTKEGEKTEVKTDSPTLPGAEEPKPEGDKPADKKE